MQTNSNGKRKRISLDMRNGAVGIGGYPTVVTALPIFSNGELSQYLVSHSTYMKYIAHDDLVCACSNDIPVLDETY